MSLVHGVYEFLAILLYHFSALLVTVDDNDDISICLVAESHAFWGLYIVVLFC